MRPQLAALLLAVCCSGAALASAALYSDQAGLNEWHKELLGRVTHSSICSRRPRAFVATEQNVLASLHLRDGSILWRHLLGERDTVDELAYSEENRSVYTLHRRSATLRSWNSTHGSSLWELATPGSASDASAGSASALLLTDVNRDGIADVVVYFAGVVSAYHGLSGRQLWAFGESRPSDGAALVRAGDKLMAVAWSADETAATVLYASSGEVKATVDTTALAGSAVRGAAAAADTIVLMTEQQKLCVLDPVGQSATCTGVDELAPELQLQEGQLAQAASAAGHVVVTSVAPGRGAAVLKLAESRQLQLVRKLPGGAAGVSGVLDADGLEVAALLHRGEAEEEAGGQRLAVYSLETGEVVLEHAMPEELAAPRLLSVSFYRRREGGRGYRVLAQGRHLQLVLLQQGKPLWAREEALAMLRAVAFTDLPYLRPQEQADLDRQRHLGFLARIRMHLLRFKKQVKISTPAEDAALAQLQEALSDRNNPSRDKNGLRKQILALSAAGTMHSLLSSSGLQLWRTPLPEGAVPKAAERGDAALLPWRSSHDRYGHPQVAAVPMRAAGTAAVVQAHSGALLSSWEVAEPILQLFPLPPQRHGPLEEQHVYAAVVDAGGGRLRADVLPPSAAAAAADLPALHFWTVDAAAGRMQGYRLPRRAGDELEPTWTVVLPGAVLAATQRNPEEVLHSHVKVLGDQTIKFKFQSPNVVAVVCGLADEMVSDAVDIDSLTLTLLLLDTVTGRIIWQQSHPGARGPAHVVMLDNTAVAHYWSAANHRWEVTVLEMYDQSRSGTISVLDVVSGHAGSTNTSAFVYRPVEVLRQSFFARTGVRVMKPTQTALGVTNRHVLMGTVLDQVYSLDARLLNPRRPASKQLKPEERMEGLVPYSPNLGMNPLSFATYNRQVAGLRDIFTAPSVLESTGHMLAVGVDLFYSKLSPAGLFDSMHDDFPYAAIVITAAALLLGSSLLHWMAKNSALKQKWA